MQKEEITRRLYKMNRAGTTMTIYSNGGEVLQTISDSLIPLRVQGDHFWLLWKPTGYLEKPELSQTIKVVDHLVNTYLEDEVYGVQWLTVTLEDDSGKLYLVEIIEPFCDPEAHRKWRKWLRYRKDNKERCETIDAELMEQHKLIADTWGDGFFSED